MSRWTKTGQSGAFNAHRLRDPTNATTTFRSHKLLEMVYLGAGRSSVRTQFTIHLVGIMSSIRGKAPLSYRHIGRARLDAIFTLDLDPDQVDRYLGPLEDMLAVVRLGLAHALFGIEAGERPIGFYVIHPDRRDNACWWLGWFALDRHVQGCGYGRAAFAHIMLNMRRMPACRRVRLFAYADNTHAMNLYAQAGFRRIGVHSTGELILEAVLPEAIPARMAQVLARLVAGPGHVCHEGRLRSSAGPYAARMIGVQRGPPAAMPGRIAHHNRCYAYAA
ncbi:MAG TPA: GNAT family N-acetyltransferase [Rhodopila sp.]